ncbi:MAG: hypothetical protein WCF57_23725 [Pyrinomonadaceae bacterium]
MRVLSAAKLLSVWERAQGQLPVERALALLAAACPETKPEELARISIGRRDALLLAMRESTFGPQLLSRIACRQCGESLELTFNVSDIRIWPEAEPPGVLSLNVDDYEVDFRLPNSEDLIPATGSGDVESGGQLLFARCVLRAAHDGEEITHEALPERVRQAVVNMMAEADAQSDVRLDLACPSCRHHSLVTFDIVSYFWSEINDWAYRLLREAHTLAAAYGWREADILAMSSWRRQVYLEMIGG